MGLKLAVIAGLLVGMGFHAAGLAHLGQLAHNHATPGWHSARIAFGLLITVQGFETSRYLKEEHSAAVRIATMRYSQWISTGIYVVFIGLASVVFMAEGIGRSETAIIQMIARRGALLAVPAGAGGPGLAVQRRRGGHQRVRGDWLAGDDPGEGFPPERA